MKLKNKKALSEIVSYVLLITIALSLAVGVYSYMKFYVPKENAGAEKCQQDLALSVIDTVCADKKISVIIENKGLFNVYGFLIKGSNNTEKIPTSALNSTEEKMRKNFPKGFYDFNLSIGSPLKPQAIANMSFDYSEINSLKVISIQPYSYSEAIQDLVLCGNIITSYPKGCE